ncbi:MULTISPECIES: arsenate reductase family protein [Bacillales]|jgi:arsenate reductase|uniref:Arsenate reductase n=1 Tax=Brevibacillus aydinogluensis TaxID=927786 RepID=A0AA48M889_9BACL|nr:MULTISPECIES: arsenate reductase family protein [Bacillales]MBR8660492.1 arsenate reductase family protein [Brevibacillus sp. NL20B1]NNV03888.1 arsenate reductase family protein [Brevibacillus sp. MCWH]UFJ61730.1 arsenate reductase family protein [Anoxybacillus sediminis]CAJ1001376.1 Arsenate reductase [Brevibacillus aydinogluensis]
MTIKAYLYDRCGTCRKAKQWLNQHGVAFEEIPIVEAPPSKEELRRMWQASGLDLRKFFNTSGQHYRELGLKDKLPAMSEEEMLELLSSNGKLIKRPLVTDGNTVTVGFKEDEFEKAWGAR